MCYTLSGHRHSITRLVYAPDHDLLLGSGFDYDVYVWDMSTKLLTMNLSGHRSSVVSICLVYNPYEHAVTVDDSGTIKVWNIDRADNKHAEVLQTLVLTRDSPSQPVLDAATALPNGNTVAILADSLYMVDMVSSGRGNESRPLSTGIGICESSDALYVITGRVLSSCTLSGGQRLRRYLYMEEDRVESATGVSLSLNRETLDLMRKSGENLCGQYEENDLDLGGMEIDAVKAIRKYQGDRGAETSEKLSEMKAEIFNSLVDSNDDITAVTSGTTRYCMWHLMRTLYIYFVC